MGLIKTEFFYTPTDELFVSLNHYVLMIHEPWICCILKVHVALVLTYNVIYISGPLHIMSTNEEQMTFMSQSLFLQSNTFEHPSTR